MDRPREAVESYRQALAVDPTLTRAYVSLGRVLSGLGEQEEALRYLRHGMGAAADPSSVAEALAEVETSGG